MPYYPLAKNYYDLPLPVGMRIGRLTVVGWKFDEQFPDMLVHILRCDCGKVVRLTCNALKARLLLNVFSSMNCVSVIGYPQTRSNRGYCIHGDGATRLYHVWHGMKRRCSNPKARNYYRYGGRGIKVCDEWLRDYHEFKIWAVNHGYAKGLQIDRIDNDGNYEPSNCRWVTAAENMRNRSPGSTWRTKKRREAAGQQELFAAAK